MSFVLFSTLIAIALYLRGGGLHNHLVLATEGLLNKSGFETKLECPQKLPDGKLDFVDILAKRDGILICFEIETTPRYVLTNAVKARQLNLSMIVIVPNKKVQSQVTAKLKNAGITSGGSPIYIFLLSQLDKELTSCLSLFIAANS